MPPRESGFKHPVFGNMEYKRGAKEGEGEE